MERAGSIQTRVVLDKFLLRLLREGIMPDFLDVIERVKDIVPGVPITKPIEFRSHERINVENIKDFFYDLLMDIETLYTILDAIEDELEVLAAKKDVISRKYGMRLRELEAQIQGLTSYYSTLIYDTFTDNRQVNATETTAAIDIAAGIVSLPETGLLSKRIIPDIKGQTLPIGFKTNAERHYNDKATAFWHALYGEGPWRHFFECSENNLLFSFNIQLNTSINGIILDSLSTFDFKFYFTQDEQPINFQPIPAIKTLTGSTRVSFPELYCTWIKVEGRSEHKDSGGKFTLLINDLGFTNTGFSGNAELVSSWFGLNGVIEARLDMDADIPAGCGIDVELQSESGKHWYLKPGNTTVIGKAERYHDVLIESKTKTLFESSNKYSTTNGIDFYKIKLGVDDPNDIEGIIRGYGCMRARTFSDTLSSPVLNVIRTSILKSRIVDLYRPREAVLASDAIRSSTDYDYEISVNNNILYTDNMTYISTVAWGDTPFDYVQTRADNAAIYYIKAYNSDGEFEYIDPNKVRNISGKKIYMDTENDSSLFDMSDINEIRVGYKAVLNDKIVNGSVSVFLNEDVELVEGVDYVVDYTNKQVVLKKDFDGVLSVRFSIETDTVDYTEFSTIFYLKDDLSTKLSSPLVLGKHDEVRIGGIRLLPGASFPDLKAGSYTFVYKTADLDPLKSLYSILTLTDTNNKMIFRDYFDTPRLSSQSMKKVDIDYLLYNSFSNDRMYALIEGGWMVIPWLPYYSSLDDCVFPVAWKDDDGNDISNADDFKTYVSGHSERFYVLYNKKVEEITGKHRLVFRLKRGTDNTTPVLRSYRLMLR